MSNKAYSYLRFSTTEQQEGDSFRRQTQAAEDYAKEHGLELDRSLKFSDLGVSAWQGSNIQTGALGAFKRAVEDGVVEPGSYLLVESLDRISRQNHRQALRVLEDICDLGITLVTLSDKKEYTSEILNNDLTSFIMSLLIFVRANEESEMKSKRLKEAWKNKRDNAKEKPMSAIAPKWLKLNEDRSGFEVLEDRAEVVKDIFKLYLKGLGQTAIAKELNSRGIKPWGKSRTGRAIWQSSYVSKILSSRATIGEFTPNKQTYVDGKKKKTPLDPIPNYYPRVITKRTFDRVQTLRHSKESQTRGRKATAPVKNILSYLGKCPLCGSTMTRLNKRKNDCYLVCVSAKHGAGCKYKMVNYSRVEGAILANKDRIILGFPADSPKRQKLTQEMQWLELELSDLQDQFHNLMTPILEGRLKNTAQVNKVLEEIESKREELQRELEQKKNLYQTTSKTVVDIQLKALKAAFKGGDIGEINTRFRELFSSVVVDYETGYLAFDWKHGEPTEPTDILFDAHKVFKTYESGYVGE